MPDANPIAELLDRLLGPRIGYAPASWPRRVYEVIDRLAKADNQDPVKLLTDAFRIGNSSISDTLLHAATIGHTAFFRHPEQFQELARVLPMYFAKHHRPIRIWCAACSTGEEAYSIALSGAQNNVPVEIVATDVNPVAIQIARSGNYSGVRAQLPGLSTNGDWNAPSSLRQRLKFEVSSIAAPAPAKGRGPFDLIFCRNVLIYFEREDIPAILTNIAAHLNRDGSLVISPADAVLPIPECLMRGDSPGWLRLALEQRGGASLMPWNRRKTRTSIPPAVARRASLRPTVDSSPIDRAAQLLGSGKPQEAEIVLTALLNQKPDSIAAWFLLGEALLQRGETAQARAAFQRASRSTPENAEGIDGEALQWAATRRALGN